MVEELPSYVFRTPEGAGAWPDRACRWTQWFTRLPRGRRRRRLWGQFPGLSLEQAYGAIAFYLRNRGGIARYLAEQDARWEQVRQESAGHDDPLMKHLQGMKAVEQVKARKLG